MFLCSPVNGTAKLFSNNCYTYEVNHLQVDEGGYHPHNNKSLSVSVLTLFLLINREFVNRALSNDTSVSHLNMN